MDGGITRWMMDEMMFLLSRLLGLLYSQLQCHMMSCNPLSKHDSSEEEEEEEEAFSLTLCTLARHLAETVRKCCSSLSILPSLQLCTPNFRPNCFLDRENLTSQKHY